MNIIRLISFLFVSVLLLGSCKSSKSIQGSDKYIDDPSFKVVGYLSAGNFDAIDSIELDKITHLCLAFANPDENGNLIFSRNTDVKLVVKKSHEVGVKVLVSLAGGGAPDKDVWRSVLSPDHLSSFIANIMKYVDKNELDGVDVDIEWNLLPAIDTLYTPFVLGLREALHAKGKVMSCALNVSGLHPAVTQKSLEAYDFISIMVYDKTGPWTPGKPGQHSPYSYAEEAYKYWTLERKIASERLVLGMPFYGHNFEPVGSESYSKIIESDISNAYKDQVGELYYNGIPEIVHKTELAKEKFNGVMFWELSQDAHNELSLLRAVDQTLKAGECKVSIFFKDEDGDGYGDLAKPGYACIVPSGYVSSGNDPDDSDADIHP